MEVSIFEAVGLPEGAILSVRAGSTRRQAPVPLAGPLRFPNLPFNAKQFKVDVMQTLGSSKVEINANKELESYSVSVDVGSGQPARVGFTVREQPSLCGKRACELKQVDKNPEGIMEEPTAMQLPPEKARAALDSRSYAREHNIPNLVQEMLQHVLREKPEDPFMVMSEYFRRKGEEMGEKPQAGMEAKWPQPPPAAPAGGHYAAAPAPSFTAAPAPGYAAAPAPGYAAAPAPGFATAPAPGATAMSAPGQTLGGASEQTMMVDPIARAGPAAAKQDPFATTEALIMSSDPVAREQQRKLQSQMTYPGEYYIPNIPGEDPHAALAKTVLMDPLPTEFPEDPAAHIQKAPPPPPGVYTGPPPPLPARAGGQAPPAPAYGGAGYGQSKAVPPPAEASAGFGGAKAADRFTDDNVSYEAPPLPPAHAGGYQAPPLPPAHAGGYQAPPPPAAQKAAPPPGAGPAEVPQKVPPPTSRSAARGESDPERLRLEAEHLSLQSEKASLLRELEILSVKQPGGSPPGARA